MSKTNIPISEQLVVCIKYTHTQNWSLVTGPAFPIQLYGNLASKYSVTDILVSGKPLWCWKLGTYNEKVACYRDILLKQKPNVYFCI